MIHILIHRCSKENMYKAYDDIGRYLLNTCPLPIKRNKPAAIIYVSSLMKLEFRSGYDASKLRGLRPDYINADSYIVDGEMFHRCTQDNPIIDDIYKFIDHFIIVCNEAIGSYAREYFKDSDVEIAVTKTYEEVRKE